MTVEKTDTEQVYAFIAQYIKEKHIAPAYREIAAGTYLSLGNVQHQVILLEAQGRLTRQPGLSRSLALVDPDDS